MFDLEKEIEGWRREMAAAGLSPDVLLELEEHLREDIERETHSGASESKAFRLALRRIGKPSALRNEFDLIEPAGLGETLRRHRWKLVLCLGLGLAAAVAVQIFRPAPYRSEAKLLIRSVIADRRLIVRAPVSDIEVARLLSQEVEILNSRDLARSVAVVFGPEKILRKAGGGDDLERATNLLHNGLQVWAQPKSNVIHVAFRHSDPSIIQRLLDEVIAQFLRMHVENMRAADPMVGFAARISNISRVGAPSGPSIDFAPLLRMQTTIVAAFLLSGLIWILFVRSAETTTEVA